MNSGPRALRERVTRGRKRRYTGFSPPNSMKTYVNVAVLVILIVGSLIWLAAGGISDTKTYYKTIPELQKMGSAAHGQRLRVGGDVKPGSIVRNGSQVAFTLYQGTQALSVIYTGTDPLPDTFKDNAQALADGRLGPDGVFTASKIQAKCASKYESKPSQRDLSHPAARTASAGGPQPVRTGS